MADFSGVAEEASHRGRELIGDFEPKLGESRWRSVDKELLRRQEAINLLTNKVEEYMEHARRIRNQLQVREDELVALKGACSNSRCRLHRDHMLGCQEN